MIRIAHGWNRRPFDMSATRTYLPEEVMEWAENVCMPYWVLVDSQAIMFASESLALMCEIVSTCHNSIAYNAQPDDGFTDLMQSIQDEVAEHMEAESSSDDEYVTSDEDLVYEEQAYR